ncbi:two-component system histidine kinase PnpS [Aureibacillus halotolerans]|uniref:histidine kinase n=1 Tax=Aureibacillus halotolerans TaxID=1508390 RepID=A0A4V3D589_9BACI|nr:PAS/PAC sensor signal transduction histidine kinase [Aureibacillus halotolerans]
MKRIHIRLPILLTITLALSFVAIAFVLGQAIEQRFIEETQNQLSDEATFIGSMLEENDDLLDRVAGNGSTLMALYDEQGSLLTTTQTGENQVPIPDNVRITSASANQQNEHYLYTLVEVDLSSQGAYLFVGKLRDEVTAATSSIWWTILLLLGLALLIITFITVRITMHYSKPIESATRVATELARGNYKARTYEQFSGETGSALSQSINILARNLQKMVDSQEMQKDRLRTLIESMGSSLLLIDGKGSVNLLNKTYKETFYVDENELLYRNYYDVLEHQEVIHLIEEVFMTEKSVRKQMRLSLNIERKHFEVYGTPIIGEAKEWKGIVLVFHDITDLKKLENTRKDFVANVSHELKTPITSIRGFTETLLDGAGEEKELREHFLSIILKESERLQSLIHDLLDLSRIEQEGFVLNVSEVSLADVVQDTIDALSDKAGKKNIELFANSDEKNELSVKGDSLRIRQILYNLMNNAIAYTPEGGNVHIAIQSKESGVELVVSDSGIGIETSEIPRIFERFYRVDKDRSRHSGGTGLGLAIVKHLVEAHSGQIRVDSSIGNGTTFTVRLPNQFT